MLRTKMNAKLKQPYEVDYIAYGMVRGKIQLEAGEQVKVLFREGAQDWDEEWSCIRHDLGVSWVPSSLLSVD